MPLFSGFKLTLIYLKRYVKFVRSVKTPFYDQHIQAGGKMVDFAGYAMPVQYQQGIIDEHLHTRSHAGLFDVSHMGQIVVKGSACSDQCLEKLMPIDLDLLAINQQAYSFLTTEQGTLLDDLIVTRLQA